MKRVLRSIKLTHIAAVDSPAQEHARVALIKRRQDAPSGNFMAKVTEIESRDGIARTAAMSKARLEFPAEFADFQSAPAIIAKSEPSPAELAKAKARSSFNDRARGIAKSEGVGFSAAMTLARRRHPVEFQAAYS